MSIHSYITNVLWLNYGGHLHVGASLPVVGQVIIFNLLLVVPMHTDVAACQHVHHCWKIVYASLSL